MPFRFVPRRDRKLNRVAKAGATWSLRRNESVFQPDDPLRDLFLVRSGHVRLWLPAEGTPRPPTVAIAGPGEIFGLEAAVAAPGLRHRYGARAGELTTLTVLDASGVINALRTGERTFTHTVRSLLDEVTMARRFGSGRAAPTTAQRVADVLLDLADRFGFEEGSGLRIELRLTHALIADLAGAHRSTVTTLINDWMYRRILKDGSKGLVVRPKRLDKLSSGSRKSRLQTGQGQAKRR